MTTNGALRAARLVRAAGRDHLRWAGPAALLCAGTGWWLLGPATGGDGTVLGILAAGGWGLGLLPVHSDSRPTGPARRRPSAAPAPPPATEDEPQGLSR
ncbi:hypothetical protein KNE206_45450 [Kitasatospora sp. NE20-6]|uniref:hypothetical protein n=1 Tax=Kitasatospora sp. NE20-6 TaxID=2859066 RepID=UPI0034DC0F1C